MTAPTLPDFVGIGALKAGTTYLDSLLRGHPDLSLPKHLKEAEYFSRHHARGPGWYAGLFDSPDGRLRGEISPQYISSEGCPGRIADANPDVRILVNLRDPVQRAVSQYRHWVQETGFRGDLLAFLDEHPNARDRSHYATDLAAWIERFGENRVHVVVFEDLVADPAATVSDVLDFLDVDTTWVPPPSTSQTNASVSPRFPRTYALAKRVSRQLGAGGHGGVAARLARTPAARALKGGRPVDMGIPPETTRRLAAEFDDDVSWVSSLLCRDMHARWSRTIPD